QNIVDLSERAALLTRQLLAFARKPALTRRPTSMPELVRATADLVTRTLQQEVALDVQEAARDGSLLIVEADSNQLQQALINLTLNARDALANREAGNGVPLRRDKAGSSPAPITFRVREATLSAERAAFPQNVPAGNYVLLEVEDTGHGMTAEVL